MLLRLSTLMTGRTGARPQTVETYAALLNAGITPVVHEYGSLGCSGDLAPLSSIALALMGEGSVRGLIGLVDAADSSKALAEIPFTFDAHKGTCVNLPGVQHGQGNSGDQVNVIALVAFQNSTQWSASGKSFNASLQIRDGNVTKFALTPSFFPLIQVPTATN